MIKDNESTTDLTFLAQSSKVNSNHDHIDKTILDTPQTIKTQLVETNDKNIHSVCVVCDDHASGFNYGALTCASCKTFFRRNALQSSEKIRCLGDPHRCSMSYGTRRKCQHCRLKRCFAMGMKKSYFVSEEEIQRRWKRRANSLHQSLPSSEIITLVPSHPHSIQISANVDKINTTAAFYQGFNSDEIENVSSKTLRIEDWLAIQTVEASYVPILQQCSLPCPNDFSDHNSFNAYWQQVHDQVSLQSITFLRQIKEFEALDEDDRFTLMKYNLGPICILHNCAIFNRDTDTLWNLPNLEIKTFNQFLTLFDEENIIRDTVTNICFAIIKATEEDYTVLHLLIVTLFFSKGLSMIEDEPRLNDPLLVHQAQSHYIRLLWNYLLDKQGERKTIQQFTKLLNLIFRIQSKTKYVRNYSRILFNLPNVAEFSTPLLRSILHIV